MPKNPSIFNRAAGTIDRQGDLAKAAVVSQLRAGVQVVLCTLADYNALEMQIENQKLEIERLAAQIVRFEQLGELYARWNVDEMRAVVNDQARADHEEIERLTNDLKRATEDELRFCVPGCPSRAGDKCTKNNFNLATMRTCPLLAKKDGK